MPRMENVNIEPLEHQSLYLMEGLPTRAWVDATFSIDGPRDSLIIVDDMWAECTDSPVIKDLLQYGRSHFGVSLFFCTQYYFENSKKSIPLR